MAVGVRIVVGERAGRTSFDEMLTHDDAAEPDVEIGGDDPVQLLYTSGTTSAPKGAIMTNRNLIAQYVSDIVDGEYHRDDIELHALPLYHCAALHDFLTPDVYLGATSVIVDSPDPETIPRTIEAERIAKMFCPPTVWIRLLRSPEFDRHDLSSLRKGYYGAAIMPVAVLQELGERLPNVRLFNFYGQTELAPERDRAVPSGADHQGGYRRVGEPERRDPAARRQRPAGPGRADRRDRAPHPARHARLLGQARGHRRGLPKWLVP